jgi:HTH-type transcriptional regulator / antitoxin HigA
MERRAVKTKGSKSRRTLPKSFAELNRVLPLRPIHDDVDLRNAQEILDELAVARNLTRDQGDYRESLTTLVEAYESRDPFDTSDITPIDALKELLDSNGMSGSELGRLLGNRELGPAILRGDRQLSKSHIMKLCAHFKVGPQLFLAAD